jgi:hypothetical protein
MPVKAAKPAIPVNPSISRLVRSGSLLNGFIEWHESAAPIAISVFFFVINLKFQ